MKTFIFQTGHAKGLTRAELQARFSEEITDEVENGLLIEFPDEHELAANPAKTAAKILDGLGGVVRISEVMLKGPANMPLNFEEWIVKSLREIIGESVQKGDRSGKFRFGLSMHPKQDSVLKKILNSVKNTMKSEASLRFVNKDFQNLSSVQAWHEKLLGDNAVELHLFKSENSWYLSRTRAIQNFEWYSERDYNRPHHDAKNGMFPPKLAQTLINLALADKFSDKSIHVFDPFCGSGTVLQEALLMDFPAHACDFDETQVKHANENMEWLRKICGEPALPEHFCFKADATKLTEADLPKSEFVIVSETWLGPPLKQSIAADDRVKLHAEIEKLYEDFFQNLASCITKPLEIVFTAPYHREGNDRHFLENLPTLLSKYGEIVKLSTHPRPSLFFERKNQFVSREIWKYRLHPKK